MPAIAEVFVTVMPDTSRVAPEIRKAFVEADRNLPKFTAQVDTTKAEEQLDKTAKKPRTATVNVDADTAKAEAQIDAVGRDRKATVEVDADTLGSSVSRGIAQGGQAGVGALQPALMGVGITMAAGIASALSGLTALLPAGIAGAGGVIGTLALGLDGVKDAWDAAGKAAQSSGSDQAAKAREVTSAQRSLRDAVQSEEQAQKDVATARKDALRQLRDLNMELHGGALDEKQAQLDALKARQDLATGQYKTAIDYAQAQLRVEEADQRVAEVHQRNIDLQTKARDAQAKGVDGADNVVSANQRLAKSQEQVAAAQDSLNQALTKPSASIAALDEAMANLSPVAQGFVESMRGIKPLFDELKFSVQDSLLAGLGPQIQGLVTTYLPMLKQGFGSMAGVMNQAFGDFTKFMTQPQTMAAMQQIFANIGSSFGIWAQSLQPVTQALLTITQVGSGFLPGLAKMMVDAGNAFNQFIQQAAASGQLQQWIQTGITALSQLGQMLTILGPMFLNLAPIGTATLGAINTLLTSLAPAITPLAGLFSALITEMTPGLGILGQLVSTVITGVAPAFTILFNAMAPVAQQFAAILGPVLAQLAPVLAQMSAQIGTQLATAIQQLTPQLIPMAEQFAKLLQDAIPLLPQLMNFGQSVIPLITGALSLMIPWTTQMMEWIDKLITKVPGLVSPLLGLVDALDKIGGKVSWLVGPLGKLLSLVPGGGNSPSTPYPAGTGPFPGIPGVGQQPNLIAGGVQINDVIGTPSSRREHQGLPPMASALTPSNGFNWDAVAQAESSGNWGNNDTGHNGHYGGLQFSPETWKAFGGLEFAPMPNMATREQQIEIANRTAFSGYNGQKPQGLGAWETITKGMVPGITTNTQPGGVTSMPPPAIAPTSGLPDAHGAKVQVAYLTELANSMGLKLTAGKNDHVDDGLNHPKGLAGDFSNGSGNTPQELAFAQTLSQNFGDLLNELIYSDPNFSGTISMGKPHQYDASTLAAHQNHVHASVSDANAPAFIQRLTAMMGGGMSPFGATPGPTGAANDPYFMQYPQGYKPPGPDLGELGQNMGGDIGELFGFDGSLFKNPAQFGSMKFLSGLVNGLTGIKIPTSSIMGGDGAMLPGGGGGGLGSLLSNIPAAFGPLKIGGQEQAPGQFMPTMPGDGGANTVLPDVMNGQTAQTGAPGGNGIGGHAIDNRIVINGNVGMDPKGLTQHLDSQRNARARQPLRALPGQG